MESVSSYVRNAVEDIPIYQVLAMLTSTLNIICSGMFFGWTAPSLPKLLQSDSPIPMTHDEGSWIAVTFLIGGVCGSCLAGVLLDRIGRKNVILLTSLPFFISWLMVAYADSVYQLLMARFLGGIADGLVVCGNCLYLAEISEAKIRGFIGCSITVSSILGSLVINIIGSHLSVSTTALVCLVIPVLTLLTFSWMPESPYYLIMKGKLEQAKRSLQTFRQTKDVQQELKRLTLAIEKQNLNTGKYLDLFTVKSNRKALFITMGTRGTQQLSGSLAIMFYAQVIFKEAGDEGISPATASTIFFVVQLLMAGLSTVIVDKTGRRPLMITSIIGVILVLLIETSYFFIKNTTEIDTSSFTWVSIVALIAFNITFNLGLQTVPFLMVGEVFPTNVKAFAVSFSDVYFCLVASIVSKFFQFTKDAFGLHVPFLVFTVCTVVGLLFTIVFVPETKGKTLEEIQQELKGEPAKSHAVKSEEAFMTTNDI